MKKKPIVGFAGLAMLILGWFADWPIVFISGAGILVYALFVGHVKIFG